MRISLFLLNSHHLLCLATNGTTHKFSSFIIGKEKKKSREKLIEGKHTQRNNENGCPSNVNVIKNEGK